MKINHSKVTKVSQAKSRDQRRESRDTQRYILMLENENKTLRGALDISKQNLAAITSQNQTESIEINSEDIALPEETNLLNEENQSESIEINPENIAFPAALEEEEQNQELEKFNVSFKDVTIADIWPTGVIRSSLYADTILLINLIRERNVSTEFFEVTFRKLVLELLTIDCFTTKIIEYKDNHFDTKPSRTHMSDFTKAIIHKFTLSQEKISDFTELEENVEASMNLLEELFENSLSKLEKIVSSISTDDKLIEEICSKIEEIFYVSPSPVTETSKESRIQIKVQDLLEAISGLLEFFTGLNFRTLTEHPLTISPLKKNDLFNEKLDDVHKFITKYNSSSRCDLMFGCDVDFKTEPIFICEAKLYSIAREIFQTNKGILNLRDLLSSADATASSIKSCQSFFNQLCTYCFYCRLDKAILTDSYTFIIIKLHPETIELTNEGISMNIEQLVYCSTSTLYPSNDEASKFNGAYSSKITLVKIIFWILLLECPDIIQTFPSGKFNNRYIEALKQVQLNNINHWETKYPLCFKNYSSTKTLSLWENISLAYSFNSFKLLKKAFKKFIDGTGITERENIRFFDTEDKRKYIEKAFARPTLKVEKLEEKSFEVEIIIELCERCISILRSSNCTEDTKEFGCCSDTNCSSNNIQILQLGKFHQGQVLRLNRTYLIEKLEQNYKKKISLKENNEIYFKYWEDSIETMKLLDSQYVLIKIYDPTMFCQRSDLKRTQAKIEDIISDDQCFTYNQELYVYHLLKQKEEIISPNVYFGHFMKIKFEHHDEKSILQGIFNITGASIVIDYFPKGLEDSLNMKQSLQSAYDQLLLLHEHQIIHGDVKKENIRLDKDGIQAVFIDYGTSFSKQNSKKNEFDIKEYDFWLKNDLSSFKELEKSLLNDVID